MGKGPPSTPSDTRGRRRSAGTSTRGQRGEEAEFEVECIMDARLPDGKWRTSSFSVTRERVKWPTSPAPRAVVERCVRTVENAVRRAGRQRFEPRSHRGAGPPPPPPGVEVICVDSESDPETVPSKVGTERQPPTAPNCGKPQVNSASGRDLIFAKGQLSDVCHRTLAPNGANGRETVRPMKRPRRKAAPQRFDFSDPALTDEEEEEARKRLSCVERRASGCLTGGPRYRVTEGVRHFRQLVGSAGWRARITVVNTVDDDGPPPGFRYTDGYVYSELARWRVDGFSYGCSCSGPCVPGGSCLCAEVEDGEERIPSYKPDGRVNVESGTKITECSDRCACPPDCTNRVVQKGRKVWLEIFKTEGKGWGVRTRENISRGTFVEKYAGEVVTIEEAEARGREYDAAGMMYLFDMDGTCSFGRTGFGFSGNEEEPSYAVDASRWGNASHFFNHSCEPNLAVWSVFRHPGAVIHDIAFFAITEIAAGEELAFDYKISGEARRIRCLCAAPGCRGWLC